MATVTQDADTAALARQGRGVGARTARDVTISATNGHHGNRSSPSRPRLAVG